MSSRLFTRFYAARGFTLIELLIVIIIVAVLLAIAVPTYLAQQTKAKDSAAKQHLNYAYRALRGDLPETNNLFPSAASLVATIQASEPELSVAAGNCSTPTNERSVVVDNVLSSQRKAYLYDRSGSGSVWRLTAPTTDSPTYSKVISCTGALATGSAISAGNEITDSVRAAAAEGDGRPAESSTGFWLFSTNDLVNGGGEGNSATGWVASTVGGTQTSCTASTDVAKFGSYSLKLVASDGTLSSCRSLSFNYLPSTTYTVSGWYYIKQVGAGTTSIIDLGVYNSGPQVSSFATLDLTKIGQWQYASTTFTTNSGSQAATYVDMPRIQGTLTGQTIVYADGLQVEAQSAATPYINTTGATRTRSSPRLQLSAASLDKNQGWFAVRARFNWTQALEPGGGSQWDWLVRWGNGTPRDTIDLLYGETGNSFSIQNWVNGSSLGVATGASQSWGSSGTTHTIIGYWTPTTLGVSVDGSAFATAARSQVQSVTLPATLDVGTVTSSLACNCDIFWFAAGTGTLGSTDASSIYAFGNNDPLPQDFSQSAQAKVTWDGETTQYVTAP